MLHMKYEVLFSKDQEHYKKGFLYFYSTDIAGYFIINTGVRVSYESIKLQTSPFSNPFRYSNYLYIIDLLYFTNFIIYTDMPRITIHHPFNEFTLIIRFKDINYLMNFINELQHKMTLKTLNDLSHYYIIKYHQPFVFFPEFPTKINEIHEEINCEYIRTHLKLLHQTLGPISNQRPILASETFEKSSLFQSKLGVNNRLECYLRLLNLPDLTAFDSYLEEYLIPKKQWTSRTPSQLRRSSELFEIIDKVKSVLDMSNEKLFNQIIFDVMMTLIQLKMSFVDEISNIYKIIKVILHLFTLSYSKYQPNNPIITINDTYDLSIDTVESVVFWILFQLIYRFEIVNIHKNTKDNLFELIPIYVSHKIPFLHEFLVKKSDYLNIECLNASAHCLFCDFFDIEHCIDMWSVGLAFTDSNNYFLSLVIAILIFHLDLYEDDCQISDMNQAIKTFIAKMGQDFLINASALICLNRESIISEC